MTVQELLGQPYQQVTPSAIADRTLSFSQRVAFTGAGFIEPRAYTRSARTAVKT
jgi:hypothetical protein